MENKELHVGFNVEVVNDESVHFEKRGQIVRIAQAIDKFYVVEFEGGDYAYFKEEDLELFEEENEEE